MKINTTLVNFPYFAADTNIITNANKANLKKLQEALEKNGVEKNDIKELIAIVKSEEPDMENRQLGEKANEWILKVFGKVVNRIGKINPDLTANSLATFIKQYYEIDNFF